MKSRILIGLSMGLAGLLASGTVPLRAQMPGEYQEVLTYLGRTGDFKADVLTHGPEQLGGLLWLR